MTDPLSRPVQLIKTDAQKVFAAAETAAAAQVAKQEGWVRRNRLPLGIGAGVILLIVAIAVILFH